jgi:hypothetical protein
METDKPHKCGPQCGHTAESMHAARFGRQHWLEAFESRHARKRPAQPAQDTTTGLDVLNAAIAAAEALRADSVALKRTGRFQLGAPNAEDLAKLFAIDGALRAAVENIIKAEHAYSAAELELSRAELDRHALTIGAATSSADQLRSELNAGEAMLAALRERDTRAKATLAGSGKRAVTRRAIYEQSHALLVQSESSIEEIRAGLVADECKLSSLRNTGAKLAAAIESLEARLRDHSSGRRPAEIRATFGIS